MKMKLKGRRFHTVEEIQAEQQTVQNTLTKKYFQDALQKWKKRWDRCMHPKGTTLKVMVQNKIQVRLKSFY
jgi:hypothetical protein